DPLRELVPGDALGGVVLIACAVVAMSWANSPWSTTYFGALSTYVPVILGPVELKLSVLHWINDLVMAVFFLVVGLEIKREFLAGELKDPRRAALPIAGALGGMLVPALIYVAFNQGGPGANGWGIPMATDIAFSLGVLSLLGRGIPRGISVFLAALAIADDLGAVLVIALFYTANVDLGALWVAGGLTLLLFMLQFMGVKRLSIYLAIAPFLWYSMYVSGVHATIAGVLLGWTIPLGKAGDSDISDSPLETLEHALKPWVAWVVMPLFALANAGVAMRGMSLASLAEPVASGVGLGLLLGKPIGIIALSFITVRLGWARLPRGAGWLQVAGVGMLAGIGFTVALFVASLSFKGAGDLEPLAKVGILTASTIAGVTGALFLRWGLSRAPAEDAQA
ncbi:MAG: Na+/H+ antiporter NhaA, partial [Candidatus Eisenbacteria bacterium]